MTIAISLKVNDGVVLATDSASTIMAQDPDGELGVINVYDNANKLFNLHKELPVGIITWGAGSIGLESTSTVIKDFRENLNNGNILLDENAYSIEEVSVKFRDYFMKKYKNEFDTWPQKPDIGFIISGFSKKSNIAEEWIIEVYNGICKGPTKLRDANECGLTWQGQPEAISRLISGFAPVVSDIIINSGLVDKDKIGPLLGAIHENAGAQLIIPAMPIKDAIELAEFLVYLTEKFVRFSPGAQTVGGPIEIASITAHEGFKWIKRKHYYNKSLN